MAKPYFGLLAGFEAVLPDEAAQAPEIYLRGVDRLILLRLASGLLNLDPATTSYRPWRNFLDKWFNGIHTEFAQKIFLNCERLEKDQKQPIQLYHNIAAFRFFEFAYNLPESVATQSAEDVTINSFKAYLTFVNSSRNYSQKNQKFWDNHPEHNAAVLALFQSRFPTADLENYNLGNIIKCQLVKAVALFEFLEKDRRYSHLLDAFYQHFKIRHWTDYFQFLLPIIQAKAQMTKEGWLELSVNKDENYNRSVHFLEILALQTYSGEEIPDFIKLRANPLFKVKEGRYCLISDLFVCEKIYKSLYFHLKAYNEQLPANKQIPNLRSRYGQDFAETYLLNEVLGYIYEKRRYLRLTGTDFSILKVDGAPDQYIRNGIHLLLWENKETVVGGAIKSSGDLEAIMKDLEKKLYFFVDDKGKKVAKAILQLAENVKRALGMENEFDTAYNPDVLHIYPILVLNDASFDAPGLNRIINDWFRLELSRLQEQGYNIHRVKLITVINMDTLILYSQYLRAKKTSLEDLIVAYHKKMSFPKHQNFSSQSDIENSFAARNFPFSVFMDTHTNNGYRTVGKGMVGVGMRKAFPERIEQLK